MDGFGALFCLEEEELGDDQRGLAVVNLGSLETRKPQSSKSCQRTHAAVEHDDALPKQAREYVVAAFASALEHAREHSPGVGTARTVCSMTMGTRLALGAEDDDEA